MQISPNLIGKIFGRLTVVCRSTQDKHGNLRLECVCACGKKVLTYANALIHGRTKSCGCLKRETIIKISTTHGLCGTPEGSSWGHMMDRCYNKNSLNYATYGAVGRKVCEFIRATPQNVITLIGERPDGKTLDRTDNKGSYTCGACKECLENGWPLNIRWATQSQQMKNTCRAHLITINGVTKNLIDWSRESGLGPNTILGRIKYRYSDEELLSPEKKGQKP